MKSAKKLIITIPITFLLITGFSAPFAQAQGILPSAPVECTIYDKEEKLIPEGNRAEIIKVLKTRERFSAYIKGDSKKLGEALGCAIKTGQIHLFMLPYFVTSLVKFLIGLAGLISVLFIVLGGYKYIAGGLTEDKEGGKKTIMHALVGLIVSLSAWIIVNLIMTALTS